MGIKNFKIYAETFFGSECFGSFNLREACCEIKDFFRHHVLLSALSSENSDLEVTGDSDNLLDRCGIYVDLASFFYGPVMKELEKSDEYKRITSIQLADDVDDRFDVDNEKETNCVVVELSDDSVRKLAEECGGRFVGMLGDLFTKSYRVYLAYDTFSPQTKKYEQNSRKKRVKFSLAATTREKCYKNIASIVKQAIARLHRNGLEEKFGTADPRALDHCVETAIKLQFSPDLSTSFAVGEGEWKCFYRLRDDIAEGLIDRCYVFGRDWDIGLAMTLYQHPKNPGAIRYVYNMNQSFAHVRLFDEKERALHFICLCLFGNDYVGKLVNLSQFNVTLLKREFDRIHGSKDDYASLTLEHLEFLSRTLFGRRDLTETEEFEEDSERRAKLSRAFAAVITRLLLAVYGKAGHDFVGNPDTVDTVLWYAGLANITCSPNEEAQNLRKMLIAQRQKNEVQQKERPEKYYAISTSAKPKQKLDDDNTDDEYINENTLLTCRNEYAEKVMRTLQQCVDSFATGTLWYLSYALFYFRSPTGRCEMQAANSRGDGEALPLIVGLCTGRDGAFRYNDRRLDSRYDLCTLSELKRAIQGMTICCFYWVVESAFDHAINRCQ